MAKFVCTEWCTTLLKHEQEDEVLEEKMSLLPKFSPFYKIFSPSYKIVSPFYKVFIVAKSAWSLCPREKIFV